MADTIIIFGKPHEYSGPTGHMANPSTMMHGAQALEHGAGIDRRALAEVFVARLDPDTGCFPSDLEHMAQERPLGVELRGGAQGHDLVLRLDHVHVEASPVAP